MEVNVHTENELYHYGMPRRSGRYKFGSGKQPYQNENDPRARALRKKREKRDAKKENRKNNTLPDTQKKISELSDEELIKKINRANLERTYQQLFSETQSGNVKEHKIRKMVSNAVFKGSEQALTVVVKNAETELFGKFLDKTLKTSLTKNDKKDPEKEKEKKPKGESKK